MIPTKECLGSFCGVTSHMYEGIQGTGIVPTALSWQRPDFAWVCNDGAAQRMRLTT
jgi:hypothetical protein